MLGRVQNELFDLGADIATPGEEFAPSEMALRVVQSQVDRLEAEIDAMNLALAPLKSFILPGGGEAAARVHLARDHRPARRAVGGDGVAPRSAEPAGADLFEPPVRPSVRAWPTAGQSTKAATYCGNPAQPGNRRLRSPSDWPRRAP